MKEKRDFFEVGSLKRAISTLHQGQRRMRAVTAEEAEELDNIRRNVNRVLYGRIKGRWASHGLTQGDWVCEYLSPTPPELRVMVIQLYERIGSLRAVAVLLGIKDRKTIKGWIRGTHIPKPHAQTTRLVWLTWAMICQPWRTQSVWHLMTWGRFTVDSRTHSGFCELKREPLELEASPEE